MAALQSDYSVDTELNVSGRDFNNNGFAKSVLRKIRNHTMLVPHGERLTNFQGERKKFKN